MASLLDFFFPNVSMGTPGINPNAPDPRGGILGINNQELMRLAMGRPSPLINIGATLASLGGPIGQNVASGLRQQASQGRGAIQNLLMLHNLQEAQRKRGLLEQLTGLISGEAQLPDEAARIAAAEEGQELPSRDQRIQGLLAQLDPGRFLESQFGSAESRLAKPNPKDFTPASLAEFQSTGDPSVLVPVESPEKTGLQPPNVVSRNLSLLDSVIKDPDSSAEERQTAQRLKDAKFHEALTPAQLSKELGIAETRDLAARTGRRDERAEALKATKQPRETLAAASAVLEDVNAAITEEGRLVDPNTGEPPNLPGVNVFRIQVGEGNVRLFSGIPVRSLTEPQRRLRQNLQRVVNSRLTEGAGKSQTLNELKNIALELGLSVDEDTLELKIVDEDRVIQGLEGLIGRAVSEINDRASIDTTAGKKAINESLKRNKIDRFFNGDVVAGRSQPALNQSQAAALSFEEAMEFVNTVDQATWNALYEPTKNAIKRVLSR